VVTRLHDPSRETRTREISGLSVHIHPSAGSILHAGEEDLTAFFLSALEEHKNVLGSGARTILKNAPESAVTLVEIAGFPTVCVKEFRWRGWLHALKGLFRPTQGSRTFRNGRRLNDAGVPAASPLALIAKRSLGLIRTEWVVMEVVPGAMELDRYILTRLAEPWTREEERSLTLLLGRFTGTMHAKGIFHSDLKTCNILVADEVCRPLHPHGQESRRQKRSCSPRFALVDYDDVTFSRDVNDRRRTKNLVQIFLSTPVAIRASSRLRFLTEYALHAGIGARQKRRAAREVIKAASGRHILYVGFQGDIVEEWEEKR
jgi:tRNA A-37 threonylcarbamoyl transferase component Bud32